MPAIPTTDASDPTDPTPELLLAIARVELSLRTVLAAIADIQRHMANSQASSPYDVPLKPDKSWAGTP